MTYLAFLVAFLVPPILLVYAQLWRMSRFGASKLRPPPGARPGIGGRDLHHALGQLPGR